jgi:outer membrane murein-binding lipoprotein Lpp
MGAELVIASVTILPATITAVVTAYIGLKRLKVIGFAVNGEMTAKFERINDSVAELHTDVRELKAEVRAVKSDMRDHRFDHFGDGK